MTNFDFLLSEPRFSSFAEIAVSSEKLLHIDHAAAAISCRRALEFALKWMYSVDEEIDDGEDTRLVGMIENDTLRAIVDMGVWGKMTRIRDCGNDAAHDTDKITMEEAEQCVEDLFYVMDYIAYCYAENYDHPTFDKSLLELTTEEALSFVTQETIDVEKLAKENRTLRKKLTERRRKNCRSYCGCEN